MDSDQSTNMEPAPLTQYVPNTCNGVTREALLLVPVLKTIALCQESFGSAEETRLLAKEVTTHSTGL